MARRVIFILLILTTIFCFHQSCEAQTFDAGVVLGVNASQIDGDKLAGFNKLGLHAGLVVLINLQSKWKVQTELLFSQRGSRLELISGQANDPFEMHLNYVEIPVVVSFMDWLDEEDNFYKLHFQAGLSYGNLVSKKIENNLYAPAEDDFNNNDVSWLVGFTFYANTKLGLTFRYSRSANLLFNNKNSNLNLNSLRGYFLTFRGQYSL